MVIQLSAEGQQQLDNKSVKTYVKTLLYTFNNIYKGEVKAIPQVSYSQSKNFGVGVLTLNIVKPDDFIVEENDLLVLIEGYDTNYETDKFPKFKGYVKKIVESNNKGEILLSLEIYDEMILTQQNDIHKFFVGNRIEVIDEELTPTSTGNRIKTISGTGNIRDITISYEGDNNMLHDVLVGDSDQSYVMANNTVLRRQSNIVKPNAESGFIDSDQGTFIVGERLFGVDGTFRATVNSSAWNSSAQTFRTFVSGVTGTYYDNEILKQNSQVAGHRCKNYYRLYIEIISGDAPKQGDNINLGEVGAYVSQHSDWSEFDNVEIKFKYSGVLGDTEEIPKYDINYQRGTITFEDIIDVHSTTILATYKYYDGGYATEDILRDILIEDDQKLTSLNYTLLTDTNKSSLDISNGSTPYFSNKTSIMSGLEYGTLYLSKSKLNKVGAVISGSSGFISDIDGDTIKVNATLSNPVTFVYANNEERSITQDVILDTPINGTYDVVASYTPSDENRFNCEAVLTSGFIEANNMFRQSEDYSISPWISIMCDTGKLYGNTLYFDGIDDYIDTNLTDIDTTNMSFIVTIMFDDIGLSSGNNVILDCGDENDGSILVKEDGLLKHYSFTSSGVTTKYINLTSGINTYCLSIDDSNISLETLNKYSTQYTETLSASNLTIWTDIELSYYGFNDTLYDIVIFNRVLTSEEKSNYSDTTITELQNNPENIVYLPMIPEDPTSTSLPRQGLLGIDDLVANTDMDGSYSGGVADDWAISGTVIASEEEGLDGKAQGITNGDTGNVIEEYCSFVEGQRYKVTVRARKLHGDDAGYVRLLSSIIGTSTNILSFYNTEWETKTFYFTATATTSSPIRLYAPSGTLVAFDYVNIVSMGLGVLTGFTLPQAWANAEQLEGTNNFTNTQWSTSTTINDVNKVTRTSTSANYTTQTISKRADSLLYQFKIQVKKDTANYVAIRLQGLYPARIDMCVNLNDSSVSISPTTYSGFTGGTIKTYDTDDGYVGITGTVTSDDYTTLSIIYSPRATSGVIDASDTSSTASMYIRNASLEQIGVLRTPLDRKYGYNIANNLVKYSENFDTSTGAWTTYFTGYTVDGRAELAPDNTYTAHKITTIPDPSHVTGIYNNYTSALEENVVYETSVWLKGVSGGEQLKLNSGSTGLNSATSITLTTDWVQYTNVKSSESVGNERSFQLTTSTINSTVSFYMWHPQCVSIANTSNNEYYPTTDIIYDNAKILAKISDNSTDVNGVEISNVGVGSLTDKIIVATVTSDPYFYQYIPVNGAIGGRTFNISNLTWTDEEYMQEVDMYIIDDAYADINNSGKLSISGSPIRLSFDATMDTALTTSSITGRIDLNPLFVGDFVYVDEFQFEENNTYTTYYPTSSIGYNHVTIIPEYLQTIYEETYDPQPLVGNNNDLWWNKNTNIQYKKVDGEWVFSPFAILGTTVRSGSHNITIDSYATISSTDNVKYNINSDYSSTTGSTGTIYLGEVERVQNLLKNSENLLGTSWIASGITLTGNTATNWDVNDKIIQRININPEDKWFTNSIYLTGSGTISLNIYSSGVSSSVTSYETITLTSQSTEYVISKNFLSGWSGNLILSLEKLNGNTVSTVTLEKAHLYQGIYGSSNYIKTTIDAYIEPEHIIQDNFTSDTISNNSNMNYDFDSTGKNSVNLGLMVSGLNINNNVQIDSLSLNQYIDFTSRLTKDNLYCMVNDEDGINTDAQYHTVYLSSGQTIQTNQTVDFNSEDAWAIHTNVKLTKDTSSENNIWKVPVASTDMILGTNIPKLTRTLSCNGSSSYISLGTPISEVLTEMTITCKVNINTINGTGTFISTPLVSNWNGYNVGSQKGYMIRFVGDGTTYIRLEGIINDGVNSNSVRYESLSLAEIRALFETVDTEISLVYKALDHITLYVNGTVVATSTSPPIQMVPEITGTYIGRTNINTGYLNGKIWDVAIVKRAFTDEEINNTTKTIKDELRYHPENILYIPIRGEDPTSTTTPRYGELGPSTGTLHNFDLPNDYSQTELLTANSDLTASSWIKERVTVTGNQAVAPDETLTADKIIATGVVDPFIFEKTNASRNLTGRTFTFTVWLWTDELQPKTATIRIIDESYSNINSKAITLTTKPKKYTITATIGLTSDYNMLARIDLIYNPSAGDYIYAWNASLQEQGTVRQSEELELILPNLGYIQYNTDRLDIGEYADITVVHPQSGSISDIKTYLGTTELSGTAVAGITETWQGDGKIQYGDIIDTPLYLNATSIYDQELTESDILRISNNDIPTSGLQSFYSYTESNDNKCYSKLGNYEGIISSYTSNNRVIDTSCNDWNTIYSYDKFINESDDIVYVTFSPTGLGMYYDTQINMLVNPDDFSISPWGYGGNMETIPNSAVAPDGTMTATRFLSPFGTTNGYVVQNIPDTYRGRFTQSVWLRGNGTGSLKIQENGGSYTSYGYLPYTLTDEWVQYSVTGLHDESGNIIRYSNDGTGYTEEVYAWNPSFSRALPSGLTYISSSSTVLTTNTGYISIPTDTTLTKSVVSDDLYINVVSTSGFNDSGYILIESEIISYSSKSDTYFTILSRGVANTNSVSHELGNIVYKTKEPNTVWYMKYNNIIPETENSTASDFGYSGAVDIVATDFIVSGTSEISEILYREGMIITNDPVDQVYMFNNKNYCFSQLQSTGIEVPFLLIDYKKIKTRFDALNETRKFLAPNYIMNTVVRKIGDDYISYIKGRYLFQKEDYDYKLQLIETMKDTNTNENFNYVKMFGKLATPNNLMYDGGTRGIPYTGNDTIYVKDIPLAYSYSDNSYAYFIPQVNFGLPLSNTYTNIIQGGEVENSILIFRLAYTSLHFRYKPHFKTYDEYSKYANNVMLGITNTPTIQIMGFNITTNIKDTRYEWGDEDYYVREQWINFEMCNVYYVNYDTLPYYNEPSNEWTNETDFQWKLSILQDGEDDYNGMLFVKHNEGESIFSQGEVISINNVSATIALPQIDNHAQQYNYTAYNGTLGSISLFYPSGAYTADNSIYTNNLHLRINGIDNDDTTEKYEQLTATLGPRYITSGGYYMKEITKPSKEYVNNNYSEYKANRNLGLSADNVYYVGTVTFMKDDTVLYTLRYRNEPDPTGTYSQSSIYATLAGFENGAWRKHKNNFNQEESGLLYTVMTQCNNIYYFRKYYNGMSVDIDDTNTYIKLPIDELNARQYKYTDINNGDNFTIDAPVASKYISDYISNTNVPLINRLRDVDDYGPDNQIAMISPFRIGETPMFTITFDEIKEIRYIDIVAGYYYSTPNIADQKRYDCSFNLTIYYSDKDIEIQNVVNWETKEGISDIDMSTGDVKSITESDLGEYFKAKHLRFSVSTDKAVSPKFDGTSTPNRFCAAIAGISIYENDILVSEKYINDDVINMYKDTTIYESLYSQNLLDNHTQSLLDYYQNETRMKTIQVMYSPQLELGQTVEISNPSTSDTGNYFINSINSSDGTLTIDASDFN